MGILWKPWGPLQHATANLPFSIEEVREICAKCPTCREVKPNFFKADKNNFLVKATRPMERLSMDFKTNLARSKSGNCCLLIVVDEYSRYPFAFPCKDMTSNEVIKHLKNIFLMFGIPDFVHSDRGTSFMSDDVKSFLMDQGVPSSRSTPYHSQGNSQCERFVGSIWKAVKLCMHGNSSPEGAWEDCIPQAISSYRALLCTATNETPHDRFLGFKRKIPIVKRVPTWLRDGNNVFLRRFVRNKSDPLVDPVIVVNSGPIYSRIRFASGREDTFSNSDLAQGTDNIATSEGVGSKPVIQPSATETNKLPLQMPSYSSAPPSVSIPPSPILRRSNRTIRPLERLTL